MHCRRGLKLWRRSGRINPPLLQKALIIFVRNPVLGKVKTRLAKKTGAPRALEIYRLLLHHTHVVTRGLDCDKWVFYADEIGINDLWEDNNYHKALQQGRDLGERMHYAFQTLFEKGCRRVVIIGSDCMELTQEIITNAFAALLHQEVYVGPSADGGYYLLGLTAMHSRLFGHMPWSTGDVLPQTLNRCKEAGLRVGIGPVLHDIDEEADWDAYLATQALKTSLVFVYNADSGLFNVVTDWMHKIVSPSTYACSLCALTHHHAGMRRSWKEFIEALPYRSQFLHKDEFVQMYPDYKETRLPAVFVKQAGVLQPVLSADKLDGFQTVEELKQALHQLMPV